jgi:hypothetical protein
MLNPLKPKYVNNRHIIGQQASKNRRELLRQKPGHYDETKLYITGIITGAGS